MLIDYIFERDSERNRIAMEILKLVKGLRVFAPRIFLVEFISVAKRLGMRVSKSDARRLTSDFVLLSEDVIFDDVLVIAENVHPRAADAYFMATAKIANSVLITNDRVMANNAKKAGIEVYYLIEECDKAEKRLRELKELHS